MSSKKQDGISNKKPPSKEKPRIGNSATEFNPVIEFNQEFTEYQFCFSD
jgi:hypothetical protein